MDLFRDGESCHEAFQTSAGWVLLIADVQIAGKAVELHNILIEPLELKHLYVGTEQMYGIRSTLLERVKQAGYTVLVIAGERTLGRNSRPGGAA